MCGRYASSRRPEDLVAEFEISDARATTTLEPDYNVAPTKEVYAVVQRPPRPPEGAPADTPRGPAERQLGAPLGPGAVVGQGPLDRQPDDQRPHGDGGREAGLPPRVASRRCLLPADGYFEWYPTQQLTKAGKPVKQPFFITPKDGGVLAMAGLYEIWRDPTRGEDDPDRFRWTCTVLTTEAEDAVGHIHDRMPLMVDRERWGAWLDPEPAPTADLLGLLTPAAPGRLDAYPVATLVNNVRNNGPELLDPLPLDETPLGD